MVFARTAMWFAWDSGLVS